MECPGCNQDVPADAVECPHCGVNVADARRAQRVSAAPRGRVRLQDALAGYAFLLPNIIGFLAFTLLPVIAAVILSFTSWDAIGSMTKAEWVGARNYVDVLGFHRGPEGGLEANDPNFWRYGYNTVFLMLGIPIGMTLSFFCALLMNQSLKGIVAYRTIYFLPSICSGVAVSVLWRWLLQEQYGLINAGLAGAANAVGLTIEHPPGWLTDPSWAKPALILMGLWAGVGGYNCILYLAGLQGVPQELYEAAEMDGAGWWHRLRHVTWPMLSPTTFFIFVMSIIAGFQGGFTAIHILTKGGPAGATTTLFYYIYQHAFQWFKMGRASALAVVLFVVILIVTMINWKYGKKAVTYMA